MIDTRDVFPKAELQRALSGRGSDWSELWGKYFDLATDLAHYEGIYSSVLEDFQNPAERTCDICMTVHDTNEYGGAPCSCVNAYCQEHRAFWSYSATLKRPGRALGYHTRIASSDHPLKARSTWFKKQMSETFGSTSLFDVPEDMRLSTLMTMTLMRMSIEARAEHDQRIAAAPIGGDSRPEVISDHQRAGTSNSANGASFAQAIIH